MSTFIFVQHEKEVTRLQLYGFEWQNAVLGNQLSMFRSEEDDPEVNL